MKKYTVKLTDIAISQIKEIIAYIAVSLGEPGTARKWADFLQDEISALEFMPGRFPLLDSEKWKREGIRKMNVKNFIVYYYIDDSENSVWVIAVIYGRRDQIAALKDIPQK